MRLRTLFPVALALLSAVPAMARQDYATYVGPDAVHVGAGGTKISKNGVDYWTSGTPPMRFQVLGILIDRRSDRLIDRDVVGSKSIARRVLEAKGDAIIIGPVPFRLLGAAGLENYDVDDTHTTGVGAAGLVHKRTRQMLVVHYLPPIVVPPRDGRRPRGRH